MQGKAKKGLGILFSLLLCLPLLGINAFAAVEPPELSCKGAVVMDCDTGEVYFSKNIDIARPVASMTKIMTLYLLCQDVADGKLGWETQIPVSQHAADISSDTEYSGLEHLTAGAAYSADTLTRLAAVPSCNGSIIALAEYLSGDGTEATFVGRMNETAANWGLTATFADCTGFEDDGNAVTPRAMATIARHLITEYPVILQYTATPSFAFQGKTFESTNKLLREGSYFGIDGLKSGTTSGAGCCYTGTASRDGHRLISVVMGAASDNARFRDTSALLDYGFEMIDSLSFVSPTSSAVMVDGKEISFDAYLIADNNYFKLRDLAMAVTGSEKQFDVSWDGAANAIALTAGQPYTAVGGELSPGAAGLSGARVSDAAVFQNGEAAALNAYTIRNNNYFKLRDLCQLLDIGVTWSEDTNTVTIDTAQGYTEEQAA